LGIASGLGRIVASFPNALGLPLALDGGVEIRVLCFGAALSVVTTVLFGLAPALQTTRMAVLPALKESGNSISGGGHDWLRNLLLAIQVAFSMILLVGGGLFGRSVMRAWSIDLGFRTEGLLTAGFSASPPGSAAAERLRSAQRAFIERLRTMPGVESAALASDAPQNQLHSRTPIETNDAVITADRHTVGSGFFHTVGIRLLSGREFDARDDAAAPKVALVNQTLAARLGLGTNPLGRSIVVQKTTMQVVGVVGDSKYGSVWAEPHFDLYVADSQAGAPANYVIMRTRGNPAALASTIAKEWNGTLPRAPLGEFRTADELLSVALAPQRLSAMVFGAFGLMAMVLASVGIYSVMAYAVSRRTREIGIRLAIGAKPGMVVRQILGQSMAVAGAGVAAGLSISALLARFVAPQVKGIPVYDGATFASVAALVVMVAFLAAAIPARRAARIDPQAALRAE
jgi:putative ABC transport system permease protein